MGSDVDIGLPAAGLTATCQGGAVAFGDAAVLIRGPAGAGKSTLALQLVGLGAALVADDLVALARAGDGVTARCPNPALAGAIEARGLGLVRAPHRAEARVALVALVQAAAPPRLPEAETVRLLGCVIPLVRVARDPHVPVALMLLLQPGRPA